MIYNSLYISLPLMYMYVLVFASFCVVSVFHGVPQI